MKKKSLFHGLAWLTAFAIWTVLVCLIDVQPIGPMESTVGFATLNGAVHKLIGEKLLKMSLLPIRQILKRERPGIEYRMSFRL